MSDKKPTIIDRCKNLKAVFEALSVLKKLGVILGFLGSLGGVGYLATDDDPEPTVQENRTVEPQPEYALKGHTHSQPVQTITDHAPSVKQAIDDYDKKHDPQQLGH